MGYVLTRLSGLTFSFFLPSDAVAENGLVEGREPSPRMDDGAAWLRMGMDGRDADWEIGGLKALAREASIGERDRIPRVWLEWLID